MLRNDVCWLLPLLAVLDSPALGATSNFSGVYQPNLQYSEELYAASWLVPKKVFMKASVSFESYIGNLEGATFSVVHDNRQFGLMTRDYFDMFVEHLSSFTNMLGADQVLKVLIHRMTKMVVHYSGIAERVRRHRNPVDEPFLNNTIAIIPFSTKSHTGDANVQVRQLFFLLTYYSVCMHFPTIAVAVADEAHLAAFRELNLSVAPFHVFKCYRPNVPFEAHHLMKDMLIKTAESLADSPEWSRFEFVYFTESDQILHMRNTREIHDMLVSNKNAYYMVPHRLNTMPFPDDLPSGARRHVEAWRVNVLNSAVLHVEAPIRASGSCCDDGRFQFPNCGNFWQNCREHGIRNASRWLKFGENGFPFPLITEHQGRCSYSSTKVLCSLPHGSCQHRVPHGGHRSTLCKEMPHIN